MIGCETPGRNAVEIGEKLVVRLDDGVFFFRSRIEAHD